MFRCLVEPGLDLNDLRINMLNFGTGCGAIESTTDIFFALQ